MLAGATVMTLVLVQGVVAGYVIGGWYMHSPLGHVLGAAHGFALATLLALAGPYLVYCFRMAGVPLLPVARLWLPPLAASLAMGAVVWYAGVLLESANAAPAVRLITMIGTGVLVYPMLAYRQVAWFWQQWQLWRQQPAAVGKSVGQ
jgi:hypothetical protein